MKVLATSDWHADHVTMGVQRYGEIEAAVHETVAAAIKEEVDAYLFLGDLCDPEGPGVFRSVYLATWAALNLEDHGIPSLWLVGNHDVLEDGSGESTLSPLHALSVRGRNLVQVADRPGTHEVGGVTVAAFPFTATARAYDPRKAFESISPGAVVVSHLSVPGIVPGEEVTDMARGRDVTFPFEETKRACLRLQGHYHRQQSFDPGDGGPPILVPGSLARLTFGEGDHKPGFLVLEVP